MMEILILLLILGTIVFLVIRYTKSRWQKPVETPAEHKEGRSKESLPPRFGHGIQGVARSVEKKDVTDGEEGSDEFLAFRLEIVDKEGNVQELIPVETRAKEIVGSIKEGDTLVVLGKRNRQGLLKPKGIYNASGQINALLEI
ncbi:MAG: hypothetical protein WD398_03515 [Cyclobacteriaceae bacterium]